MRRIALVFICLALACNAASVSSLAAGGEYEYETSVQGEAVLTRWLGTEAEPNIPEDLDGLPLTYIGEGAFKDSTTLESLRLPNGVLGIGPLAFYNCSALKYLTLPGTLEEIGDFAFAYCASLQAIALPEGVQRIGEYAFGDCTALTAAIIPASVIHIGLDAFFGATAGFRLYGSEGSAAQEYAMENGIPFGPPEDAPPMEMEKVVSEETSVSVLGEPNPDDAVEAENDESNNESGMEVLEQGASIPWPTKTLTKYKLEPKLLKETERIMAYLGPSKNYAETGAYKPYKMARVDGLFIEGSYVLVDLNYPSVGVRRTYFTRGKFKNTSDVPEITLIGYPAETMQSVQARYGPGLIYDPFPEADVGPNTPLTIFFEEDGYVFAEYKPGSKLVRSWINADSVTPK